MEFINFNFGDLVEVVPHYDARGMVDPNNIGVVLNFNEEKEDPVDGRIRWYDILVGDRILRNVLDIRLRPLTPREENS